MAKRNKQHINSPIIIAIGVIIALFLAFIFYSQIYNSKTNQTSQVSDETAGWNTYSNSKYGISFMYPPSLYLFDCGKLYEPEKLSIHLTDDKKNDCNTLGKGMMPSIWIENSHEDSYNALINQIKNPTVGDINIDGLKAKRIQGSFEAVGDQGEKIPSHPIESADLIFINPINSEPFAFRYHWISSVQKSDSKFFGYFKSQKDITPTFEKILSTVEFTD